MHARTHRFELAASGALRPRLQRRSR